MSATYDGSVVMLGGSGNATLSTSGGSSITMFGGSGDDSLSTSGGSSITMMGGTGHDVMSATKGNQQPFNYGSLSREPIYLKEPAAGASIATASLISPQTSPASPGSKTTNCDRLASNPFDHDRPKDVPGVTVEQIDVVPALEACNEARAEFRKFLNEADSIIFSRAPARAESAITKPDAPAPSQVERQQAAYATLGDMIVNESEVLIAMWDGEPPRGPGGTGELVENARRMDKPLVWLRSAPPFEITFERIG